ncbi:hypothetical protein [Psychroflexus sp. MBR-150]|jgi:thioredoxin-related protein
MKKIIIIAITSTINFISLNCLAQTKAPRLNNCEKINQDHNKNNYGKYKLVMISGAGCGYCDIALEKMYKNKLYSKINVIILEYGKTSYITKIHGKYFDNFDFFNAEECDIKWVNDDFFPKFYLYENNKLIWKRKGWYNNNIIKLKKATNNSYSQ